MTQARPIFDGGRQARSQLTRPRMTEDREPPASGASGAAALPTSATFVPTFQVPTPEPFTFSRPGEVAPPLREIQEGVGAGDKRRRNSVNTLIYSMGDEADDILRSLSLSEEDKKY